MRKLLALFAILAFVVPTPALTQGGSGVRIRVNYYSDAGYTNQVGEYVELCNGQSYWNGQLTEYGQYSEYDC
jgi:hypothetical protein